MQTICGFSARISAATPETTGVAIDGFGNIASLRQATEFVSVVEERQGLKIGCIEEVAWRQGWLDDDGLRRAAEPLGKSGYGDYLLGLLDAH